MEPPLEPPSIFEEKEGRRGERRKEEEISPSLIHSWICHWLHWFAIRIGEFSSVSN
jgi:hypothetical protein